MSTSYLPPFLREFLRQMRIEWKDDSYLPDRLERIQQIGRGFGIEVHFDCSNSFEDSFYGPGSPPIIWIGWKEGEVAGATVALHELAHHIHNAQHHASKYLLSNEIAAWELAKELAQQHQLPLDNGIRRRTLRTYKQAASYLPGSKRMNRSRPQPKSWNLPESRAGSEAKVPAMYAYGKKGKRKLKKYLKQKTSKALRRQAKQSLSSSGKGFGIS